MTEQSPVFEAQGLSYRNMPSVITTATAQMVDKIPTLTLHLVWGECMICNDDYDVQTHKYDCIIKNIFLRSSCDPK